ncbi:hypothetical protein BH11BAC6_BH11BAC6_15740 [soil metagenome]
MIICFHGFGETHESFAVLEEALGGRYTIVAIDLPFHGKTEWNEGLLIKPEELLNILDIAMEKAGFMKQSFSLIGYSLGGRIVMHLLQLIPEKIKRVVLLAPDGLRLNFWYWLATQITLGNKLFYATMRNPYWFLKMIHLAYKIGLLNKSIIKFVEYYLNDKSVRLMLYKRWTTMRKFKPDLNLVRKNIHDYKIQTRFVFGSYDRIILRKRSNNFAKDTAHVRVIELQTGHQLLKAKHAREIALLFSE